MSHAYRFSQYHTLELQKYDFVNVGKGENGEIYEILFVLKDLINSNAFQF